jgi:hypothetical protein
MVEEHVRLYGLEQWFFRRRSSGVSEGDLSALRRAMEQAPAHTPIQSSDLLVDEILDSRRATRKVEQCATIWIEIGPSFDWQRQGELLAELITRPRVRGQVRIAFKLLMRPSDVPRLRAHGISDASFRQHSLEWSLDELVAIGDQHAEGWLSRFRGSADGQWRLQTLYDDALDERKRTLAASPRCWTHLARLLNERRISRVVDDRDWHFAIRDSCAATRKLRIDGNGISLGGDRIDEKGLLSPVERLILEAIYELQKSDPPSAGEIATHINRRRGGRREATLNSIPRDINALRNKPFFEPVFHLRPPSTRLTKAAFNAEYLTYLHNSASGRQYKLENTL